MFVFVESVAFDRVRALYLNDDDYGQMQQFMMQTRKLEQSFVVPVA